MSFLRNALLAVLSVSAVACAAESADEPEGASDSAIISAPAGLPGLPAGSYFQVGATLAAGSLFEIRLFAARDAAGNNCAVSSIASNDVYAGPGPYPRARLYNSTFPAVEGVPRYFADDDGDYMAGTVTPIVEPEALGTCKSTGEGQFEISANFNVYEPDESTGPSTFSVAYKINANGTVVFTPVDGELPVAWNDSDGTLMARASVHDCANPVKESTCVAKNLSCVESTTATTVSGSKHYGMSCK